MSDETLTLLSSFLAIAVLFSFLLWKDESARRDCESRGGIFIQTMTEYACSDGKAPARRIPR